MAVSTKLDLRNHIFAINDLERDKVHVEEWDCDVWVRVLTGKEQDQLFKLQKQLSEAGKNVEFLAHVLTLCIVDEDGERIFGEKGDAESLAAKSGRALQRVANKALEVNGLSPEAVEELEKN